jgi:desulfoferrodoxin-like iron-binding protein
MTQVGQVYKCAICGNTVEVKVAGVGELVCCGQPMGLVTTAVSEIISSPATNNEPEVIAQEEQETEKPTNEEPPITVE